MRSTKWRLLGLVMVVFVSIFFSIQLTSANAEQDEDWELKITATGQYLQGANNASTITIGVWSASFKTESEQRHVIRHLVCCRLHLFRLSQLLYSHESFISPASKDSRHVIFGICATFILPIMETATIGCNVIYIFINLFCISLIKRVIKDLISFQYPYYRLVNPFIKDKKTIEANLAEDKEKNLA